jgi:probable HAF family extracellular repeat protein
MTAAHAMAAPVYTFTPLAATSLGVPTDPSNDVGIGYGISPTGEVVGQTAAGTAGYSSGSAAMSALGSANSATGSTSIANGITSGGIAVGSGTFSGDSFQSAVFFQASTPSLMYRITAPGSDNTANAVSGNSTAFEAVGVVDSGSNQKSFRWQGSTSGGTLTQLDPAGRTGLGDTTSAGQISEAYGLNANGFIVGQASNASGNYDGYVYSPSTQKMYDLGSSTSDGSNSNTIARGINQAGTIVGLTTFGSAGSLTQEGFIYTGYNLATTTGSSTDLTLTGSFQALAPFDGGTSEALAINTDGDVVGDSSSAAGQVAFLYEGGQMYNLNDLAAASIPAGWTLTSASSINDLGQITGTATYGSDAYAFVLNPVTSVPEPGLLGFFGFMGLLGTLGLSRRRK